MAAPFQADLHVRWKFLMLTSFLFSWLVAEEAVIRVIDGDMFQKFSE